MENHAFKSEYPYWVSDKIVQNERLPLLERGNFVCGAQNLSSMEVESADCGLLGHACSDTAVD